MVKIHPNIHQSKYISIFEVDKRNRLLNMSLIIFSYKEKIYVNNIIVEGITYFDHRTWRKQANTDLETPFLLTSSRNFRRC